MRNEVACRFSQYPRQADEQESKVALVLEHGLRADRAAAEKLVASVQLQKLDARRLPAARRGAAHVRLAARQTWVHERAVSASDTACFQGWRTSPRMRALPLRSASSPTTSWPAAKH